MLNRQSHTPQTESQFYVYRSWIKIPCEVEFLIKGEPALLEYHEGSQECVILCQLQSYYLSFVTADKTVLFKNNQYYVEDTFRGVTSKTQVYPSSIANELARLVDESGKPFPLEKNDIILTLNKGYRIIRNNEEFFALSAFEHGESLVATATRKRKSAPGTDENPTKKARNESHEKQHPSSAMFYCSFNSKPSVPTPSPALLGTMKPKPSAPTPSPTLFGTMKPKPSVPTSPLTCFVSSNPEPSVTNLSIANFSNSPTKITFTMNLEPPSPIFINSVEDPEVIYGYKI